MRGSIQRQVQDRAHRARSGLSLLLAGALLVTILWGTAVPVQAADFVVNSNDDVNNTACNVAHCSLREAILAANASAGPHTINFNISGGGLQVIQVEVQGHGSGFAAPADRCASWINAL